MTQFDIVTLEDRQVLRVQADSSYGNLVFDTRNAALGPTATLRWSWRLERGLPNSDLTQKAGDDSPIKVCALFDLPPDRLGLAERAAMRMARILAGEPLPGATLCYVWDRLLPEGSTLANAYPIYSRRVRYLVATSGAAQGGRWITHERNLAADFLRVFGDQRSSVPPLMALVVAADSDNTQGHSLAYVGDLTLAP